MLKPCVDPHGPKPACARKNAVSSIKLWLKNFVRRLGLTTKKKHVELTLPNWVEEKGKEEEKTGENRERKRRKGKKKEKAYSTGYSQAVTHPSTNPARRCLTSVIGREPVFSLWYGRRHVLSVKCSTHQKLATRLRAPSSVRTQGPHHRSRPFKSVRLSSSTYRC